MTLLFDLFASPSLFCLSLLLSLVQAQVSVVNGASVYQGTTVSQNIHGIPTLIYNCAKVPALCENVHQQYPLNDYIHTFAGVPPPQVTGHGTMQGRSHILLHYDRDSKRADQRRSISCPNGWKKSHGCPEPNQPP